MAKKSDAVLTGFHAVFEAIRGGAVKAGTLYLASRNAKARDLEALARERGIAVEHVDKDELARRGGEDARHAVLVASEMPETAFSSLEEYLATTPGEDALVVVLDHIEDPHNLGAILRSADQFGVDVVIAPSRRSAPSTRVVASASAGASTYVPLLRHANLAQALKRLKDGGFWVYGADAGGAPAPAVDLRGRVALVLGSEGRGLSRLVAERCDRLVSVPTEGHVDSLNVSVSAGILLYETRRQQRIPSV
ncbi:MAG: 23S rRNA (guanosine(2251)-2'-O)-methyltransferase RlmB [Spirochaetota bacterium]